MFLSKTSKVNFTLWDISEFQSDLIKAIDMARNLYEQTCESINAIREAFEEIIRVGEHNLMVCQEELEYCTQAKEVARSKMEALEQINSVIQNTLTQLYSIIDQLRAQKSALSAEADKLRHMSAPDEKSAAKIRNAVSKYEKNISDISSRISKLDSKKYALQKEIEYNATLIFKLKQDYCPNLERIERTIEKEQRQIEDGIYISKRALDDLSMCESRLNNAYYDHVEGGMYSCKNAATQAQNCAENALYNLGELNNTTYGDDMRVSVPNLFGLKEYTRDLKSELSSFKKELGTVQQISDSYLNVMSDNILNVASPVLENISGLETKRLANMEKKADKLLDFCDSLSQYYKCKA